MAPGINWPIRPDRTVVRATVAGTKGSYRIEFVDSSGTVMNIVMLTEAALLELAGTSCVLAEEVDRYRRPS